MYRLSTELTVVAAQLASWAELIFVSDFSKAISTPYLMAIIGIGIVIVTGSALNLRPKVYSFHSKPAENAEFMQQGIYRHVRHPLYLGVMIASSAFFLAGVTLASALAFLLVILVSNIRTDLEECRLEEAFPDYADYRSCTKKFIPYIF